MLVDPAFAVLAANTLQANATNLTGFQTSLLAATAILTRDPGSLGALVAGAHLTPAQRRSLASISRDLDRNPAIQVVKRTAATTLCGSNGAALLRQYVTADIGSTPLLGGPNTTLGNVALDAVVSDGYNLLTSNAFTNSNTAVSSLLVSSDLITFFQRLPPVVAANILPSSDLVGLMLPKDHDPVLPPAVVSTLGAIFHLTWFGVSLVTFLGEAEIFFLAAVSVLTLPFELEIVLALWVSSILFGLKLSSLIKAIYKVIHCDYDGDPSDPNDSPGNECPAT